MNINVDALRHTSERKGAERFGVARGVTSHPSNVSERIEKNDHGD